jgi:hypothetical protein
MSDETRDALREEWIGTHAHGSGVAHVFRSLDLGQSVFFDEYKRQSQLSSVATNLKNSGHGTFYVRLQRSLVDGSPEGLLVTRTAWGAYSEERD